MLSIVDSTISRGFEKKKIKTENLLEILVLAKITLLLDSREISQKTRCAIENFYFLETEKTYVYFQK